MLDWSVAEVSQFVDSLGTNGSRQNCPEGCSTIALFDGSRFVARGLDGKALHALIANYTAHEATLRGENGWFPNATALRSQFLHALLHDLLPPERARQEAAYMYRLKTAAEAIARDPGAAVKEKGTANNTAEQPQKRRRKLNSRLTA